jgi:hypothetical protein
MDAVIGSYEAVYFDDVASAVDYCHTLVPFIVPRASAPFCDDARAVVWFHVPRRSTATTRDGCYLFLSTGALAAAQRAGLDIAVSGRVTRAMLPQECVLLFGDLTAERVNRRRLEPPRAVVRPVPDRPPAPRPAIDVRAT